MLRARLHPHWAGGKAGYKYSVIYDGELLVSRSADAECDAARALMAKGVTGTLTMLNGKTGKPRYTAADAIDLRKHVRLLLSDAKETIERV